MKFQGLDLNLLVALDRLFKDQSVSVAARHLHLSQSALSHALGRLREYFGDELLVQNGRRLQLSPLAQTLVAPLRLAIQQIDSVVGHTPAFDPARSQRHFRIFASDYSIVVCLCEALPQVRRLAPRMTIELINPVDPVAHLERGDVDLVVVPRQYLAPEHPRAELFTDRYVIAVWSGGQLANEAIDTEKYFATGHVAARYGLGRQPDHAEGVTLAAPQKRRVMLTAPSFGVVPRLVVGTDLIATMPERLATIAARTLPLTLKELPFASPAIHEQVQWHLSGSADPAIAWLVALFQGACD